MARSHCGLRGAGDLSVHCKEAVMHREQAQQEHNTQAPACYVNQCENNEWVCSVCSWFEGKKPDSRLPVTHDTIEIEIF